MSATAVMSAAISRSGPQPRALRCELATSAIVVAVASTAMKAHQLTETGTLQIRVRIPAEQSQAT
jgi:hypothetical protein